MHTPKLGLRILLLLLIVILLLSTPRELFQWQIKPFILLQDETLTVCSSCSILFSLFVFVLFPSLEKENKKQGREQRKLYTLFLKWWQNNVVISSFILMIGFWCLHARLKFSYWNCLDMIKAKRTSNQYKYERIFELPPVLKFNDKAY